MRELETSSKSNWAEVIDFIQNPHLVQENIRHIEGFYDEVYAMIKWHPSVVYASIQNFNELK